MITDIQKSMAIIEGFKQSFLEQKRDDGTFLLNNKSPIIQQIDFVLNTLNHL